MERNKRGISLIALIITIIVIIILAAIVITMSLKTPEQAKYARFCNDISGIQEAVTVKYGEIFASKVTQNKNITREQVFQELTKSNTATLGDKTVYEIDESKLKYILPEYQNASGAEQKWYLDVETGLVYLIPGFEHDGDVFTSLQDTETGSATNPDDEGDDSGEEEQVLAAGLYNESIELIASWDELVSMGLDIEREYDNYDEYYISTASMDYIIDNNSELLEGRILVIPDSVTSIGYSALEGCQNLTNVIIPESVTNIGYSAFWGCRNITNIIIPESVISLGECVFAHTGLTSITIPESVTSIGEYPFLSCSSLTSITIDSPTIAADGLDIPSGYIITFYIREDITEVNSGITARFPKQATTDKVGYVRYAVN